MAGLLSLPSRPHHGFGTGSGYQRGPRKLRLLRPRLPGDRRSLREEAGEPRPRPPLKEERPRSLFLGPYGSFQTGAQSGDRAVFRWAESDLSRPAKGTWRDSPEPRGARPLSSHSESGGAPGRGPPSAPGRGRRPPRGGSHFAWPLALSEPAARSSPLSPTLLRLLQLLGLGARPPLPRRASSSFKTHLESSSDSSSRCNYSAPTTMRFY